MKNKNDVDVLINGKQYTLAGFESEEYMQKVASYINSKYSDFKKQEYYNSLDMDLKNVLMAINIGDDYFKAQKKAKELEAESDLKDKMVFDMKHEIIALQDKLEEAQKKMSLLQQQFAERLENTSNTTTNNNTTNNNNNKRGGHR